MKYIINLVLIFTFVIFDLVGCSNNITEPEGELLVPAPMQYRLANYQFETATFVVKDLNGNTLAKQDIAQYKTGDILETYTNTVQVYVQLPSVSYRKYGRYTNTFRLDYKNGITCIHFFETSEISWYK